MAIKIGLLGLKPKSSNKGCEALTFSFLFILRDILQKEDVELFIIEPFGAKRWLTLKQRRYIDDCKKHIAVTGFDIKFCFFKIIKSNVVFFSKNPKFDVVFDFTQGDSFTDIYGNDRFNLWTRIKEYYIENKIPFILGSQTIGPFLAENNKQRAARVVQKSFAVFTRDIDSYNYVQNELLGKSILTTDVAFFLPFKRVEFESKYKKFGINPSGLLWSGGYSRNNQFGLSVDYEDFCKFAIEKAIEQGYEVHLIGHVIDNQEIGPDNDLSAIKLLHELYPSTIVAPIFNNPIDAKSYISGMDLFVGARMHATIAAISSGVPVLPFSYSRKFEGLFNTLEYGRIINGKTDTLEHSKEVFQSFLDDRELVKEEVYKSIGIIEEMKIKMIDDYYSVLKDVKIADE